MTSSIIDDSYYGDSHGDGDINSNLINCPPKTTMVTTATPSQIVGIARKALSSNVTKNVGFRKEQLRKLDSMFTDNERLFTNALKHDLRKPYFESIMTEIEFVRNEIRGMLMNVESWSKSQKVKKNLVTLFDDAYLKPEPFGVVLIIGAWNYPITLTLGPLVGAIAAGNCAIIKPSELAPATADLIKILLPKYLDQQCYQVFVGGPDESKRLVTEKFDYIFYTGGSKVGKSVYIEAAKNMTPVTLELGGKSPIYFDESVDNLLPAVRRIIWGKLTNVGQTCIAPDYVLCTQQVQSNLIKNIEIVIKEFFGDDPKKSDDFGRVVNVNHFRRLLKLIEDDKNKVVIGGTHDESELYIAPTVMSNVKSSDTIMQEEIFGPILPIVTVNGVDDAIQFINNGEKPLSMYVFSTKQSVINKMLEEVSCGNVCVNDTIIQLTVDTLPFGGIGNSGIGRYRGKFSFDTFTHYKPVLHRGWNSTLEAIASHRYPPFSQRSMNILKFLTTKRWFFGN